MLIGIVTIDDMLDVAEATVTREIHRIGGSESLESALHADRVSADDSETCRLADGIVPR
jgi:Mg/Co/Ni transporter MgtE